MRESEIKLRKIGNSRGVIIPADILKKMNASDDAVLTITVNDNGIATLEKKTELNPFVKFAKFAEAWNNGSSIDTERVNKDIEIW